MILRSFLGLGFGVLTIYHIFVGHCLTDKAHLQVDHLYLSISPSVIGQYHRWLLIGGL